jgi:undecaprenyl-diphosphatase
LRGLLGWEALADLAKLAFFVVSSYWVLQASARRWQPGWTAHLARRRVAVLGALTVAMSAIKLIEDVVDQESGPIDTALLWFIREQLPAALAGFFGAITVSGSAAFLLPVSVLAVLALLLAQRRFEAALLGASMLAAPLLVYALKGLVVRDRPALWQTQTYWGSSFPSGHTLSAAAFATATALCLARIWPRSARLGTAIALLWTGLVALSRLVLGVHWPSDVLAALCLGVFLPLWFSVLFDRQVAGDR